MGHCLCLPPAGPSLWALLLPQTQKSPGGVNLMSLMARPGAQRLLSCEHGACPAGSVLTRGVRSERHIMFINMP